MKKLKFTKKTIADAFMEGVNVRRFVKMGRTKHVLLLACVIFILILISWAHFVKIDTIVYGLGKVVPSGKIRVLQHLEGGIVKEINVHEGQKVKKGQILLKINDVHYLSLYQEGLLKTVALRARVARLTAETEGVDLKVNPKFEKQYPGYTQSEYSAFKSSKDTQLSRMTIVEEQLKQREHELSALQAEISKLKGSLKLVTEEQKMTESLYRDGAAAKVEVLRIQRQVGELQGDIKIKELTKLQLERAIQEAKSKVNEVKHNFRSQAAKELVIAKAELKEQEESNISLQDRARRTVIRSPVNGIVNVLHINTIGGTIKPGAPIMEIVPEGESLLVEVKVSPQDIAFVHLGQNSFVKLTSYDFLIYGGLKGNVEHISADSVTDKEGETYYVVRIRTLKDHLGTKAKPLLIIPGMTAEVDILTGKKSILSSILKPLMRGSSKALTEG